VNETTIESDISQQASESLSQKTRIIHWYGFVFALLQSACTAVTIHTKRGRAGHSPRLSHEWDKRLHVILGCTASRKTGTKTDPRSSSPATL
jgi:hypothetical protein